MLLSRVFSCAQQLQVTAVSLANVHLWAPAVPCMPHGQCWSPQEPCSAHLRPHRGCVPGQRVSFLRLPGTRCQTTHSTLHPGAWRTAGVSTSGGEEPMLPVPPPGWAPGVRAGFLLTPRTRQDSPQQVPGKLNSRTADRQTSVGTSAQAPPRFSHCTAATCHAIHCLLFAPWESSWAATHLYSLAPVLCLYTAGAQ